MPEDRMAASEQRGDHADAPRTWVPGGAGQSALAWADSGESLKSGVSRTGLGQHDQGRAQMRVQAHREEAARQAPCQSGVSGPLRVQGRWQ